eukprot:11222602-Lingulodinium_polyedra.AAC.1
MFGVRMECATRAICDALRPPTVDSTASRRAVLKPCAMMRSSRPSATAAARESRASRTPCGHFRCSHGVND